MHGSLHRVMQKSVRGQFLVVFLYFFSSFGVLVSEVFPERLADGCCRDTFMRSEELGASKADRYQGLWQSLLQGSGFRVTLNP